MMKVLIVAHTIDEHGVHTPGDVLDLSPGEAHAYAEKQWGIIMPQEKAVIETPESKTKTGKKEIAAIKTEKPE